VTDRGSLTQHKRHRVSALNNVVKVNRVRRNPAKRMINVEAAGA
jgi:hypothetical protein